MITFLGKRIIGKGFKNPIRIWIYKCHSCDGEFWTSKRITNKEMKTAECPLCKKKHEKRWLIKLIEKLKVKFKGER